MRPPNTDPIGADLGAFSGYIASHPTSGGLSGGKEKVITGNKPMRIGGATFSGSRKLTTSPIFTSSDGLVCNINFEKCQHESIFDANLRTYPKT